MRRNPSQRPKKRDPGVPALWPYKQDELEEAERQRELIKEQTALAKAKRKQKIEQKRNDLKKGKGPIKSLLNPAEQAILDAASKHNIALRDLQTTIELADVFIYVLDARNPLAYRSAAVEAMIKSRPKPHGRIITLLNKSELIPVETLRSWIEYFQREFPTLAFQCLPVYSDANLKAQNQQHKQTVCVRSEGCIHCTT